ncbi:MAG: hypothetical protein Q9166_007889 [cf. Caloplaca sp. 2 TL-2023]
MAILPRQSTLATQLKQYIDDEDRCPLGYYQRYGNCYRRRSGWDNWGRWIVLAVILLAAFFIFFAFACVTARRRRRQGMTPYRGTGWAAGRPPPGHGPAQYTGAQPAPYYNNQPAYNNQPSAAPVYSPPPANQNYYGNGGANQGYFGGQQSGVELQQPNNSYQPQRGGDQVYSPPAGPPPGKDGIIR